MFYVQIQEPKSRSTTSRKYVFLAKFAESYYHKIFETRSWWLLSAHRDVTWSKDNHTINPKRQMPYGLLSWSCFYWANLITVASVTRDKEIDQSHMVMR